MEIQNDQNIDQFIDKFGGMTEEYKFYDGEVTLRYDPKAHIYLLVTPEGLEEQDGVTHVAHIIDKSNVLIPWACKMMAEKLKRNLTPFLTKEHYVGPTCFDAEYQLREQDFDNILKDAKSAHKDKLEDAGAVGHMAHAWVEEYIKATLEKDAGKIEAHLANFPAEERARNASVAALDWAQAHNVRFLGTERKVYSRRYKYAGTMDGLALVDSCTNPHCCKKSFKDRLTVLDWKTSNYLYIEFILQTAAYKQAYEEETGEVIEDIWIIRLGKDDAEFEAWHVESDLADLGWEAFHNALCLSRSMEKVNTAVNEAKDERKAAKKAEKLAQKQADLRIKCKNADKYKGIRKPTCNDGNPCETCLKKYNERLNSLESMKDQVIETKPVKLDQNVLKSLQNLLDN